MDGSSDDFVGSPSFNDMTRKLRSWMGRRVPRSEVSDLLQTALFRLWRGGKLGAARCPLAYAIGVADRVCRRWYQERYRHPPEVLLGESDMRLQDLRDDSDHPGDDDAIALVRSKLRATKLGKRQLAYLRALDDRVTSDKELARLTGMAARDVRKVRKSLAKLARRLLGFDLPPPSRSEPGRRNGHEPGLIVRRGKSRAAGSYQGVIQAIRQLT